MKGAFLSYTVPDIKNMRLKTVNMYLHKFYPHISLMQGHNCYWFVDTMHNKENSIQNLGLNLKMEYLLNDLSLHRWLAAAQEIDNKLKEKNGEKNEKIITIFTNN